MARIAHTLVEFSGVFGSQAAPSEEWSFGLRCDGQVAPADLATVALACETAWGTHFPPVMPTDVALTKVRVANIGAGDGTTPGGRIVKNANGSYQLADELGNTPGTSTNTVRYPPQTALVISLTTARAGATGKGRIFIPMPGVTLSTARLVEPADATGLSTRFRDFVNTVNAIGLLGPVVVASSKGYNSPVTGIRIGRAPDTMRSRRSRRDEGYVSLPLA